MSPQWSWAAGEAAPPGISWKKVFEGAAWFLGGFALQLETARLTGCSWAAPDFLVLAVLGWHFLWGLRGGIAAALILGAVTDGLSGAPLGLTVSGLLCAALVAEWLRGAAVGGFGGLWVGPALVASVAASGWRVVLWGWSRHEWPAPLDVVLGVGFTLVAAGLLAYLRGRVIHPRARRPRVVES